MKSGLFRAEKAAFRRENARFWAVFAKSSRFRAAGCSRIWAVSGSRGAVGNCARRARSREAFRGEMGGRAEAQRGIQGH